MTTVLKKIRLLLAFLLFQVSFSNGSFITVKDIETFDCDSANELLSGDDGNAGAVVGDCEESFGFFPTSLGDRCNDAWRQCDADGLYCSEKFGALGRRCLPTANECLSEAVNSIQENFSFQEWKAVILGQASLSEEDLINARRSSANFEEFQNTPTFLAFADSFYSNPPLDVLTKLQNAANECMSTDYNAADPTDTAPSTDGVIAYLGLHLEVGFLADVAMSVFWALNPDPDFPWPTAFIRGTFGAELGVGAEISGLLGFAFTGTTNDILGDGVGLDVDIALGPLGAGAALVFNTNELVSLEFSFGPGIGFGIIGLAYTITGELNTGSRAPSTAPSRAPTARPTTPFPTARPTTPFPTSKPSSAPSRQPSSKPSLQPSLQPSRQPSRQPSMQPSRVCYFSCRDAYENFGLTTDGLYPICPSGVSSPSTYFTVYCDQTTSGGKWMLFLAYAHAAGQNNALVSTTLPQSPTTGYSHRYLTNLGYTVANIETLRFYCTSTLSNRVMHFTTTNSIVKTIALTGSQVGNTVASWKIAAGTTLLTALGHNAFLPQATTVSVTGTTGGLTEFPFYDPGNYHWGIRGEGGRFECDDQANFAPLGASGYTTLHQVWVRMNA